MVKVISLPTIVRVAGAVAGTVEGWVVLLAPPAACRRLHPPETATHTHARATQNAAPAPFFVFRFPFFIFRCISADRTRHRIQSMPRSATASAAADVPADTAILCEGCGYTLDGLPLHSNCPECGKPIAESTSDDNRRPPAWEAGADHPLRRFVSSSWQVLIRPSHFFRTSTARGPLAPPRRFAFIHWAIASVLFGAAGAAHWWWYANFIYFDTRPPLLAVSTGLAVLTFLTLWGLTILAAGLTTWEARYRGYRLPKLVVLRGLYYHAAHYLPVAAATLATTLVNVWLWKRHILNLARGNGANLYLWTLSIEVIVAAMYLFWTYWAAMRNMLYANR
jgi:hypothetical protein